MESKFTTMSYQLLDTKTLLVLKQRITIVHTFIQLFKQDMIGQDK